MLNAWSIDLDHRASLSESGPSGVHARQASVHTPHRTGRRMDAGDVQLLQRGRRGSRLSVALRRSLAAGRTCAVRRHSADDDRIRYPDSEAIVSWRFERDARMGRLRGRPTIGTGEPVGGKSVFSLTVEADFPLRRCTGAFSSKRVMCGRMHGPPNLGRLLYDAGPGVRIATPFGFCASILGYQLKTLDALRIDGKPQKHRWRMNFGFGEAFLKLHYRTSTTCRRKPSARIASIAQTERMGTADNCAGVEGERRCSAFARHQLRKLSLVRDGYALSAAPGLHVARRVRCVYQSPEP